MQIDRVGIFDYGSGNILSVANAIKRLGADYYVGNNSSELKKCNRYILPGVGAYADCMEKLKASGIDEFIDIIKNDRIPMLGICVGMQVMGSIGTEFGFSKGLSLIDGKVSGMREIGLHDCNRLPNIGWRNVELADKSYSWIFDNITDENRFYFFHSYAFDGATPNVVANAQYGNISYPAVIASENMIGVQFHPEKSGKNGLQFLDNFLNWET